MQFEQIFFQRGAGLFVGMLPQAALCRFEHALRRFLERRGIVPLEEFLLLGRKQKRLRDFFVVMILDEMSRRVVAEKIVNGRSHLERAFVAVLAHRCDPAWVEDAAANHAHKLFF